MNGIDHLQSHPNSLHQLLAMSFRRFGHKTSSKRKDNAGKLNKSKRKGNTKGEKQKRQHKGRKTQKLNQKRKKERREKHEKL